MTTAESISSSSESGQILSPAAVLDMPTGPDAVQHTQTSLYQLPPITLLSVILEIGLVVAAALVVTWVFSHTDSTQGIPGSEEEWLTSSAYMTSESLHQYGYIPLWQPLFEYGEPFLDNPFTFVLNPISTGPSLFTDGVTGIKISVVLTAILAAVGGWVLGRVLGFGFLARLLLALLCLGKGNMAGMIGTGYFQLGVTQAYFPWIIAGFVGVLRFRRRWPVVLTAVAFTLMFWAGNIWYTLPMLIMMALHAIVHIITFHRTGSTLRTLQIKPEIDRRAAQRVLITGLMILGLSMITFLPIWINKDRIYGHPDDVLAGPNTDLTVVLQQFINSDLTQYNPTAPPSFKIQFYYSYILPTWFGVLLFIVLPPIRPLWKSGTPHGWRIWSVVAIMIVFTTIWGAGGNPIFIFLYQTVPLLGQWRFVGRALAVASFGIAVLVAARVDGLWRAIALNPTPYTWIRARAPILAKPTRLLAIAALIVVCAVAARQVNAQWPLLVSAAVPTSRFDDVCISWLRQQNPDKPLSVYSLNYYAIDTYLKNQVRTYLIQADFHMVPDPSTLYHQDLYHISLPPYGIAWEDNVRLFFEQNGYQNMQSSPNPVDSHHCLWYKADALSYAYVIPESTLLTLDQNKQPLTVSNTVPIAGAALARTPDRIALTVNGLVDQPLVVTIQERAYPGWSVQVDGAPARLESVGGQMGVVLPSGDTQHTVYFYYHPPLLFVGAAITLLTWLLCLLYLLYADRFIPTGIKRGITGVFRSPPGRFKSLLKRIGDLLTNPDIFKSYETGEKND
ncbi:MAG: hypothetical protein ACYDBJ_19515 [Aggregatilineales bacterium]